LSSIYEGKNGTARKMDIVDTIPELELKRKGKVKER